MWIQWFSHLHLIIYFIIEKLARYADDYNTDQNEIDQLKSDYKGNLRLYSYIFDKKIKHKGR